MSTPHVLHCNNRVVVCVTNAGEDAHDLGAKQAKLMTVGILLIASWHLSVPSNDSPVGQCGRAGANRVTQATHALMCVVLKIDLQVLRSTRASPGGNTSTSYSSKYNLV